MIKIRSNIFSVDNTTCNLPIHNSKLLIEIGFLNIE